MSNESGSHHQSSEVNVSLSECIEDLKLQEQTVSQQSEHNVTTCDPTLTSKQNMTSDTKQKNERTVLLLALSTFNKLRTEQVKNDYVEYTYVPDNIKVKGIYQLDPVPAYLHSQNIQLDNCIVLATKETLEKDIFIAEDLADLEEISPWDYFKKHLLNWFNKAENENDSSSTASDWARIVHVNPDSPEQAISDVVNMIRTWSDAGDRVTIHLDQHGGFRGLNLVLSAIISLLENEQNDINVIYYDVRYTEDVHDTEDKTRIIIKHDQSRIFRFVSGINEFMNSSRIESLERFLNAEEDKQLMSCLKQISDSIRWNTVSDFEKGLSALRYYFKKPPTPQNQYLALFQEQIKADYKVLLEEHTCLDTIKWCYKKGLFQQAITFAEANIYELFNDRYYKLTTEGQLFIDGINEDAARYKAIDAYEVFNAMIYNYMYREYLQDYLQKQNDSSPESFDSIFANNLKFKTISKKLSSVLNTEYQFNQYLDTVKTLSFKDLPPKYDGPSSQDNCIEIIQTDTEKLKLFSIFLCMHKFMKQLRNMSNHASEKTISASTDALHGILGYYIDLVDYLTK